MSACTEIDASEVRRILSLELSLSEAPGAEVRVECDRASARLWSRERARSLALESVPDPLRARLLALAIAELGHQAVTPRAAPTAPPRTPLAPPAPAPALRRSHLWLGAYGQRGSAWAAGATLGFTSPLRRVWAWSSGAAFTQGTRAIDYGQLRVRHAALYTGPALQRTRKRVWLLSGLGVRAGWLGLRGLPGSGEVRGQRFDTWFVGPTAFANVGVPFSRHGLLIVGLDLTHTVRRVNAEVRGGPARTLSPWLGSLALGIGASW